MGKRKPYEPLGPNDTDRAQGLGYVYYHWPEHPLADSSGGVTEHRLVYWQEHGYSDEVLDLLKAGAHVHHRNGKKGDNRPENLELRVSAHPSGVGEDYMVHTLRMLGYIVELPS